MKRLFKFIKKTFIKNRSKCHINFAVICDGKGCDTCKINRHNH